MDVVLSRFFFGSVQTAVINVFKGGGLQNNELYTLNENIRYVAEMHERIFVAACLEFDVFIPLRNNSYRILVGGAGIKANLSTVRGFQS